MEQNPLEQFEIHRYGAPFEIFGIDASITNASLVMLLIVVLTTWFFGFGVRKKALVPGRWQSMAELTYEFVANMLNETVGPGAKRYFPFVFTLFMFILAANLLGMIPYGFTVTSQIIVTFALATVVFVLATIVGFVRNGLGFLKLFVPSGMPVVLLPLLIMIELLSYLFRPISLSVRLFANMMAGHTLMKVFGGFVFALGWWAGWAPLGFLIALTALEIFIALLQAYVFAILTCIYLNDAFHPGH